MNPKNSLGRVRYDNFVMQRYLDGNASEWSKVYSPMSVVQGLRSEVCGLWSEVCARRLWYDKSVMQSVCGSSNIALDAHAACGMIIL